VLAVSHIYKLPLVALVGLFTAGCTLKADVSSGYEVVTEVVLPDTLAETSGLFCYNQQLLTLNDSGNLPVVYEISRQGEIVAERFSLNKNQDWEAVTADKTHTYVGDFGNNAGQRQDLVIYKRDNRYGEVETIALTYEGYDPASNAYYGHDFDAEALVARDGHLVLFSKSWNTQVSRVYKIDKETSQQTLSPVARVTGLPGVVTGADWDAQQQQYVLVGYSISTIGLMKPFVALLNDNFQVKRLEKLTGLNQVEGVCVSDGQIWLTQEAGKFSTPKLVSLVLNH